MGCTCSTDAVEPTSGNFQKVSRFGMRKKGKVHPQAEAAPNKVENEESEPFGGKLANVDPRLDDATSTAATSRSITPLEGHRERISTWPMKMFEDALDHSFLIYRVYAFLPWCQRADALCLSRGMRNFFNSGDDNSEYWSWLCDCICREAYLIPPGTESRPVSGGGLESRPFDMTDVSGYCRSHRALFDELWPLRFRFLDIEDSSKKMVPNLAHVSTFCRMRPTPPVTLDGALFAETLLSKPVTLPLGQRVALLRQRDPTLSRGAAMKKLLNKDCGAAQPLQEDDFEESLAMIDEFSASHSGVRPNSRPQTGLNNLSACAHDDVALGCGSGFKTSVLSVTPGEAGSVLTVSQGIGIHKWEFQNVFGESASQRSIYRTCGLCLATNLINGTSGSLIVYGQTGSGKTHTMFGGPGRGDGLVQHVAEEILAAVQLRRDAGFKVKVGASFIEVFGQDVSNLLGKTGVAKLCQRMGTKYVQEGRYEKPLEDNESFASLLKEAEERKRKAHTEMNERSTRAHTLVVLRVRQQAPGQNTMVESVLTLVDLGGSERVSKSKANDGIRAPGGVTCGDEEVSRVSWQEYYKGRERITETNNINKGLLALKRCVQALNERQKRAKEGRQLVRVPFADSKLTMLLEPSLSGQANTSIIVCCSQEDKHAEETVQSLRFGEMCSSVENERVDASNEDIGSAVAEALAGIDAEIKDLEKAILAKEKWEWKKTVREDIIDEKDTGGTLCHFDEKMELGGAGAVEIAADDGTSKKRTVEHEVWSQVLVGAEVENARREELLKQRQRLLGEDV